MLNIYILRNKKYLKKHNILQKYKIIIIININKGKKKKKKKTIQYIKLIVKKKLN